MFRSTINKGFQITFDNGNTVSVQWGPGNYCAPTHPKGRSAPHNAPMSTDFWESKTAEVAAWNEDGDWHRFEHDSVDAYLSPAEVATFIDFVANNELKTE